MDRQAPGSEWTGTHTGPRVCTWVDGRYVLNRYRHATYRWSVHLISTTIPGLMLSIMPDGRTSREVELFDSMEEVLSAIGARESYELEALGMMRDLSALESRWHDAERSVVDAQQPGAELAMLPELDRVAHELYREHDQAKRDIRPHLQELALTHDEILATVSGG